MVLASICVALGFAFGWCFARVRAPTHVPDLRDDFLQQQAVRLSLAQHWARGGALSQPHEPWRPVLTGLAVAALLVHDADELQELLEQARADARDLLELRAIWSQARAELLEARRREHMPLGSLGEVERDHEIRTMTGKRLDGSPDWDESLLWNRAAEIVASAQIGAENLLHARRGSKAAQPSQRVENS